MRVVATLTTLPSRYDLLRKTLGLIRNQDYPLDAIYIAVPKRCTRLNKEYPEVPQDIRDMATILRIDTDYGPATKIYGGLWMEKDPETIIISLDDDVDYPPNLVSTLVSHVEKYPNSCICGTGSFLQGGILSFSILTSIGWCRKFNGMIGPTVGEEGLPVDLIYGFAGVLYKRWMFPPNQLLEKELFNHALEDDALFHNDDVLISGYLSKMGIERRVFCDIAPVSIHMDNPDALSAEMIKMFKRLYRSVDRCKEIGFYPQFEELPPDDTLTWKVIVGLILIAVVVLLAVMMYKSWGTNLL